MLSYYKNKPLIKTNVRRVKPSLIIYKNNQIKINKD